MITFCEPEVDGKLTCFELINPPILVADMVDKILYAVRRIREGEHNPSASHEIVRRMYSWDDIASRTERVYESAWSKPELTVDERLRR
jgi:phosphatidylinositol N-acetylglucosaminyltransferase subunit A